jgi:hypothetical protein
MQSALGLAELPDVLWVPAHPSRYHARPARPTPYDLVVIHITSGHPDPMGTARMWAEAAVPPGAVGTSAHLVVGAEQAIQAVALRYAANHAHAVNGRSVGIEHAAREPGEFGRTDPGLKPTLELYARSARIAARLLKAAGLPVIKGVTIGGHAEMDPETTHKGCPDSVWDWPYYLGMVNAAYAAFDGGPLVT